MDKPMTDDQTLIKPSDDFLYRLVSAAEYASVSQAWDIVAEMTAATVIESSAITELVKAAQIAEEVLNTAPTDTGIVFEAWQNLRDRLAPFAKLMEK